MKIVLFSIRPQFVDPIFEGVKTIEFRRVCPKIEAGDVGLIYASGSTRALVGGFSVGGIVSGSPESLWRKWRKSSGTQKHVFMDYFKETDKGYGIKIEGIEKLSTPIPLVAIVNMWESFRPPQSYRYVQQSDPAHQPFLRELRLSMNGSDSEWAQLLTESIGPLWQKKRTQKKK